MTDLTPDPDEEFHRDRRQHGGMPAHPDDDKVARLTEEERAAVGLEPYDPDQVPPATGEPSPADVTASEEYQEERAEIRRELAEGELQVEGQRDDFPPTRYDRS